MITPNVAIAFPQTVRDNITTKINEGMALFPVLATVANDQRSKLSSIAEGREPYVADAYSDARANPATVPGTVSVTEWGLLEEQHAGLAQMESYLLVKLELVPGYQGARGRPALQVHAQILRLHGRQSGRPARSRADL